MAAMEAGVVAADVGVRGSGSAAKYL